VGVAMKRKVTAFITGEVQRQTEKAVNIGGRWFPKSAIASKHETSLGNTAFVIKDWLVKKSPWLVKDELGIGITKSVLLADGTLLCQGDTRKLPEPKETLIVTFDTMDFETDMLIATGISEKDAVKQVRAKYREYQKVPGGIQ
jgi:hypothetical protein